MLPVKHSISKSMTREQEEEAEEIVGRRACQRMSVNAIRCNTLKCCLLAIQPLGQLLQYRPIVVSVNTDRSPRPDQRQPNRGPNNGRANGRDNRFRRMTSRSHPTPPAPPHNLSAKLQAAKERKSPTRMQRNQEACFACMEIRG
jgi:hypothetical protein